MFVEGINIYIFYLGVHMDNCIEKVPASVFVTVTMVANIQVVTCQEVSRDLGFNIFIFLQRKYTCILVMQ